MPTPEVTVVVVTYNAPEWATRCLNRLLAEDPARVEVVVVDNASDAPLQALLSGWAARGVVVLAQSVNLGFGRACNLGAAAGNGEYVVLVNPDAVLHDGAIQALVDHLASRSGAGIVGGRTQRPDGVMDPMSCWGLPTPWSLFCFATGLSTLFARTRLFDPESLGRWPRDTVREVGMVSGCLLATTRNTWDALGGFDERYFMYGEDADLSVRARARGFRPEITPAAAATHAVGASSATSAAKRLLLFTGKATMQITHRSGFRRTAALGLLQAGVLLRALPGLLGAHRGSDWLVLWRQRAEWRRGWERDAT